MTYIGKVSKGAIVLPIGINLPDGMELEVRLPDEQGPPSLHEELAAFAGMADDLPADLARNHDHYLHGHPKK
jgi:hypothetical protein